MIEIFKINLDANESRELALAGEYFEVRNAVFSIELIEIMDKSGGMVSRLESPEESDFVKPGAFQLIRIKNGPVAQTCKFFVGTGDAGSRRPSGILQIVDNGISKTKKSQTFMGVLTQPNVAGAYSNVSIQNPIGSGVTVSIKAYRISVTQNDGVLCSITNQTLTTNNGTFFSKLSGGQRSKALNRGQNSWGVHLGGVDTIANRSDQYLCTAGLSQIIVLQEPIVLYEGYSYIFVGNNVTTGVSVTVEFYEEPNS